MGEREIDRWVAEKVMGWHHTNAFGAGTEIWYPPNLHTLNNILGYKIPNYSTSIASAWLVVERMRELGWAFWLSVDAGEPPWTVEWHHAGFDPRGICRANTAPLAICLAALKAFNVEVPNA